MSNSIEQANGEYISKIHIDGKTYTVGMPIEEYNELKQIMSKASTLNTIESNYQISESERMAQENQRDNAEKNRVNAESKREAQEKGGTYIDENKKTIQILEADSRVGKEQTRNRAESIRINNANTFTDFAKMISFGPKASDEDSLYKQYDFKIPIISIDESTAPKTFLLATQNGEMQYDTTTISFPYIARPPFNSENSEEDILVGKTPNGEDIRCKHICSNFREMANLAPAAAKGVAISSPNYISMAQGALNAAMVKAWVPIEITGVKEVLDARYFYYWVDGDITTVADAKAKINKSDYTVMEKASWIKYNLSSDNKLTIQLYSENEKLLRARWGCYGLEALIYYISNN